MKNAAVHEPDPKPGSSVVLYEVLRALSERAEAGKLKYGTYLETNNGRDALMDAFQESLDLSMYLAQAIMERDGKLP